MKFISVAVVIIINNCIYGQEKISENISAFRDILTEQFNDNSNNWITENNWISAKIENGYFRIRSKNFKNQAGLTYIKVPFEKNQDFEIETSLKIEKGSAAFIFNVYEDFAHFRVELSIENKTIRLLHDEPLYKNVKILYSEKLKTDILSSGFIKVRIQKTNSDLSIFLNDQKKYDLTNFILKGDKVGYCVSNNSEIVVDYLKIIQSSPKTIDIKTEAKNLIGLNSAPEIIWISPSDKDVSIDTYTARIRAEIRSGSGLNSILIYLNGLSKGEPEIVRNKPENSSVIIEKNLTLGPGENTIYIIASNISGATKSEVRNIKNPGIAPPAISWQYPVELQSVSAKNKVELEICIKSATAIKSAKLMLNGLLFAEDNVFQPYNGSDCYIVWKKQIILKEGDNNIAVVATNEAGSTVSEERKIIYNHFVSEKRLALVIGNSKYTNGVDLKNPVNDANLMEATLKELGFKVIKSINSLKDSMINSVKKFSRELSNYNVGLFYYAGHGIQVDGINYIIPVDAKLESKDDCKYEAIDLNFITSEFKKYPANTNIIILDACRNNPYKSWVRGEEKGFRALGPIIGTLISFATSEGATAVDGDGANGLFTEELVKQMTVAQPVESVFKNTRREVIRRSNGRQTPTEWSYLIGEFYFKK